MAKKFNRDERRQISVAFCDIVNSTKLSRSLDPEEYNQTISKYRNICKKIVDKYEGYIAQYLGDGVLIYFGYPRSHEDDSIRAVKTAIDLINSLSIINIKVRIGIHCGEVLLTHVQMDNRYESFAIGEVPNIASNILKLANPNQIVITSQLYELVDVKFRCKILESTSSFGKIYHVISEINTESRFQANIAKGLTPYIETDNSLSKLEDYIRDNYRDKRIVLLEGEAGIGKSRLIYELKRCLHNYGYIWYECQCWETKSNSPFDPILNCLNRFIGLTKDNDNNENVKLVESFLSELNINTSDNVQILIALLSLDVEENYSGLNYSSEKLRSEFLRLISDIFLKISQTQLIILVIEDLHWIDPSTNELIHHLIFDSKLNNILFLLSFRPEYKNQFEKFQEVLHIKISPFNKDQILQLINSIDKEIDENTKIQILDKSDGIPLFIEEITKVIPILSDTSNCELTSPQTLKDFLLARIDKLGNAKILAQAGSVAGREFDLEDIELLSGKDKNILSEIINRIVDHGIFVKINNQSFMFKHVLLQHAAYNSITKRNRIYYHSKYADFLEKKYFENQSTVNLEILAYHCEESKQYEKSIEYLQKSAELALSRSANQESVNNIELALTLFPKIKKTTQSSSRELALYCLYGTTLVMLKGWASEEVNKAFLKALHIVDEEEIQTIPIALLCGLAMYYMVSIDHARCIELGIKLYKYKESDGKESIDAKLAGCFILGYSNLVLNKTDQSTNYITEGVTLNYDSKKHVETKYFAQDMMVMCKAYESILSFLKGHQDSALEIIEECVDLAYSISHAHSIAFSLYKKAMIYAFRRESDEVIKVAKNCISISEDQCFPHCKAAALVFLGWATVDKGNSDEGIKFTREGLSLWSSTGAKTAMSFFPSFLVSEYLISNRISIGLETVSNLLNQIKEGRIEPFYQNELMRLKGELLLAQNIGNDVRAEKCFLESISNSQENGQKSLQLRSLVSLAKLLKSQGRTNEIKQSLIDLYNWMEECNDKNLRDLVEARNVISQL